MGTGFTIFVPGSFLQQFDTGFRESVFAESLEPGVFLGLQDELLAWG
jgi:hypothetical protein